MLPLLGRFAQHWKLKLAALALALLLWAVVSAGEVTSQWIPVPVRVVSDSEDYVRVDGPDPQEVAVRFTGPGRELLELALNRPQLWLTVEDPEEGGDVRVLSPQMVQVPDGFAARAQEVRPATVRLEFRPVVSRQVPVRVRLGEGAGREYELGETPTVDPAFVRLSGPRRLLEDLDSVVTQPLDLSGTDSAFDQTIPLDTTLLDGVRLSRARVRVSGRVDRIVERTIPGVVVETPVGTRLDPATVEVRLRGPARVLRALSASRVRVSIPSDSVPSLLPLGGLILPLELRGLPPGVAGAPVPRSVRLLRADVVADTTAADTVFPPSGDGG